MPEGHDFKKIQGNTRKGDMVLFTFTYSTWFRTKIIQTDSEEVF